MSVTERKTHHARKKAERGEKWSNYLNNNFDDLLIKGKKTPAKGIIIMSPRPLKTIKFDFFEEASSSV